MEICSTVADWGQHHQRRVEQDERMLRLVDDGLLDKRPHEIDSIGELGDFIACAYWRQKQPRARGGGGKLPPEIAEPDALVERAIELAGSAGIDETMLREALKPLAPRRFETALQRLEGAGVIRCQVNYRDAGNRRLRPQRIWSRVREVNQP